MTDVELAPLCQSNMDWCGRFRNQTRVGTQTGPLALCHLCPHMLNDPASGVYHMWTQINTPHTCPMQHEGKYIALVCSNGASRTSTQSVCVKGLLKIIESSLMPEINGSLVPSRIRTILTPVFQKFQNNDWSPTAFCSSSSSLFQHLLASTGSSLKTIAVCVVSANSCQGHSGFS